jgi:hypothetical protein
VALTKQGVVYSWGEGSEGQLGHGFLEDFEVGYVDEYIQRSSYTYLDKPRRVVGLNDHTITVIACGGNHTTALSRDYRVFEWGSWGKRLELEADGDVKKEFSPVEMRGAQELRLTQVSVGHEHTVAIGGSLWCEVHGLDESFYIIRAVYAPSIEEMAALTPAEIFLVEIWEEDKDPLEEDLTPAQVLELDTQEEVAAARKKALIDRRRRQAAEQQAVRQQEAFGNGSGEVLALEGGGRGEGGDDQESIYAGIEEKEQNADEKWEKRCRRYHTQPDEFKEQVGGWIRAHYPLDPCSHSDASHILAYVSCGMRCIFVCRLVLNYIS